MVSVENTRQGARTLLENNIVQLNHIPILMQNFQLLNAIIVTELMK